MKAFRYPSVQQIPAWLALVLILRVTTAIVWSYADYFPPDFRADFLLGRESSFFGPYQWAFYPHIMAGPVTLIAGLLLLHGPSRLRWPRTHRVLGRIQVVCVLLVAVSGLWMSLYAATGVIAGVGFASLAICTGYSVIRGWQTAMTRQFPEHERWMHRCYVLLCSAVVLRVFGGVATVLEADVEWTYPLSAWACWLIPLSIYETLRTRRSVGLPIPPNHDRQTRLVDC